jgi:HEAT repeat protein
VRKAVASALGEIGDERAFDYLVEASRDEEPGVRNAATWALEKVR